MTTSLAIVPKPWWRWPIYVFATCAVLMAALWALLLGTSPMGWSGRSDIQIGAFVTIIVLTPAALTTALALKSIVASQNGRLGMATACGVVSLVIIPLAWLAEYFRMLPF